MKIPVIINARSLSQPQTGVQRFSREIIRRLEPEARVVGKGAPPNSIIGTIWEQLILPQHISGSELLFSPANTGPLHVANQVIVIHDLSVIEHPEWYSAMFSAWYRFLIPRLARQTKKIITVSKFSKKKIVDLLQVSDSKVAVVSNGVSDHFYPRAADETTLLKNKLELPDRYFLFVGSLLPRKNLQGLFAAWRIVAERLYDAGLVIIGSGNKIYRKQTFEDIPRGIMFLGYVDERLLPLIYSGAEALVYPSYYEGFGLPVLEAMACGTPVIAARTSALPEVVGDAGLLVDPTDTVGMAEHMLNIYSDVDLKNDMINAGLRRAELYSWDVAAKKIWDILQGVEE